jgi:hypothetical protein
LPVPTLPPKFDTAAISPAAWLVTIEPADIREIRLVRKPQGRLEEHGLQRAFYYLLGIVWPVFCCLYGESSLRLQHAFYRFPFRFDVERLRAEVLALPEDRWCTHPGNFKGNSHLPLISTEGEINDKFDPPMRPTRSLLESPYLMQILGQFGTLHGRARLMRLEPGDGVPEHCDVQYYWRTHARVHIPVVTHPGVRFFCGDEDVHMAAGEAWTFDNWRLHKVDNNTPIRRIHLTFDTMGSNAFWALARPRNAAGSEHLVPFDPQSRPVLSFETYVGEPVMAPAEIESEMTRIAADVAASPENAREDVLFLQRLVRAFCNEWRVLWHTKGPTPENLLAFTELRVRMADECRRSIPHTVQVASNGTSALNILHSVLAAATREHYRVARSRVSTTAHIPRFDRPVFIVCAPRSGSTLLFETLAQNRSLWTLGGEGHGHVESIPALAPKSREFESNRLIAMDATPDVVAELKAKYTNHLRNAGGDAYAALPDMPEAVRFLEKTPKNALRIPFFKTMFPDAKFIFLHREARSNISAIMEAWISGNFVTYRDLPDWTGDPWSMLLIPGWRDLNGRPLAEIAMRQWRDTNDIILRDLEAMPASDWCSVGYEEFVAAPAGVLQRLCTFAGIPFDGALQAVTSGPLRPSRYTLTAPHPEKWRKNESAFTPFLGQARGTIERLETLANSRSAVLSAAQ